MSTERSETEDTTAGVDNDKKAGAGRGWYSLLLGPPFRLIGFFYRAYTSNRERLSQLVSRPRVSSIVRYVFTLTLFLWIVIWLLASEESRNRLTEAVKQNFRTLETTFSD